MRFSHWLMLPVVVGALYAACATGDEGSTGIHHSNGDDASAGSGGSSGSGGGTQNGGSAGIVGQGGGTQQGGSAGAGGNPGNGGTSDGGSSNGGSSNGGSSNGGSGGGGTGGSCTPPVPTGKCDTVPQCGCNAGQGCYITNFSTGATSCLTAGTVAVGGSCDYNSVSQCAAGTECVGNTCKPFCDAPADCTKSGAGCIAVQQGLADGGAADIPAWSSCTDQCNPSSASSCGSGQACFPIDDINVQPGHSLCAAAGTSTASCATVDCAASYVCMNDNTCHRWCKENSSCGGGNDCQQLQDSSSNIGYLYVGTQGYGVCP